MNKDCPKIVSDEWLYKKVFCFDSSLADNRYFRQKIVEYLAAPSGTFTQFMFTKIWERNEQGKYLKYCFFDERAQRVRIDNYFYEWMTRTISKAKNELKVLHSEQEKERKN